MTDDERPIDAELKRIADVIPIRPSAPEDASKSAYQQAKEDFPFSTTGMTAAEGRSLMRPPRRQPKPSVPYSDELAVRIFTLMAEGHMLREICDMDDMPSVSAVMKWQVQNAVFSYNLTRAREALGDHFAWEVKRVADEADPETAQADRVKMDAYKWLAAKMFPKQYGDKTITELQGSVVHETRHVIDATKLSPEHLLALEEALRAAQALPTPPTSEG